MLLKQKLQKSVAMDFDVLISGAGPAGCTAALTLKDSGLKVGMVDKATFPRDKVCGDAIPARAVKTLRQISPAIADEFDKYDRQLFTRYSDVVYGKRKLKLQWQVPAYTCTRLDFDNYLFQLVKRETNTTVFLDANIRTIEKVDGGYMLSDKSGKAYSAKIVIGADGAQSVLAKKLGGYTLDREHHIGSVRAYYKGVTAMQDDKTEIYLDKKFQPGYFWIFPIAGGVTNVGFGMMSVDIAEKKINLKKSFYDFIDAVPELKERFANAEQVSSLDGHSLPVGSRKVTMSGDRFMLCGDAASLVDPITGEGIGNAMVSGRCAALQAIKCFKSGDFSQQHMQQYDDSVWKVIGEELNVHTKAQKVLRRMPVLLDIAFALSGWEPVRKMMQDRF